MAFDTITGAIASTSTKFGGEALNKISNWLNASGSEVANIKDDDITIADPSDTTKKCRLDAGAITAGNTRVLNVPDRDIPTTAYNEIIILACSDETTALTAGTDKVKFRMPFAFYVTGVSASLSTAGTGADLLTVDINETGTSILSTLITLDATETTSTTAATAAVISDASIAADAEISVDIDQIDTDGVSKGLKVKIEGYRTA